MDILDGLPRTEALSTLLSFLPIIVVLLLMVVGLYVLRERKDDNNNTDKHTEGEKEIKHKLGWRQ